MNLTNRRNGSLKQWLKEIEIDNVLGREQIAHGAVGNKLAQSEGT